MTDDETTAFVFSLTEADMVHGIAFVSAYAPEVYAAMVDSIERHRVEEEEL